MVHPLTDPTLQGIVEAICAKGCRQVWRDLAAWERGELPVEAWGLGDAELERVLAELKAIMAVYDSCQPDIGPAEGSQAQ